MPEPYDGYASNRKPLTVYEGSSIRAVPLPRPGFGISGFELQFASLAAAITLRDLLDRWIESYDQKDDPTPPPGIPADAYLVDGLWFTGSGVDRVGYVGSYDQKETDC